MGTINSQGHLLALNPGSSSIKYALYDARSLALITSGTLESAVDAEIKKLATNVLHEKSIQAIGCRVVHGGATLVRPTLVNAGTLATIRSLSALAPLHNPVAAGLIEACQRIIPGVPIVAVFDTDFHHTLPSVAATYALPRELSDLHQLRRFGFHGIAHQFVSERLRSHLNGQGENRSENSSRLITCHLGNGASITAQRDGKSIDTSMGLTPMAGLVMGSRSGDIDPGLLLHLIQQLGFSPAEVDQLLNHQSGLLGLSGISSDMRDLEKAAADGNVHAAFALEVFAYNAAKYVGAYVVALEGLDAIAFSGGIGENSALMRAMICRRLNCLGLAFDEAANLKASGQSLACISAPKSAVSAWVIHADEELQIARESRELVR